MNVPPLPGRTPCVQATGWCRHYSFKAPLTGWPHDAGGPKCAKGHNLSAPGSTAYCWPGHHAGARRGCVDRLDWSVEAQREFSEWLRAHYTRRGLVRSKIPDDAGDGSFPCPACGTGTVMFIRPGDSKTYYECSTHWCCSELP